MTFFYTKKDGETQFYVSRIATAALGGVLSFIGLVRSVTQIDAGYTGVQTRFGRVLTEELSSGLHLINPFNSVTEMTIRTRELKEVLNVPTSGGLTSGLDVSILYHLVKDRADSVLENLGDDQDYETTLVSPTVRSAVRDVISDHKAEDLYTGARTGISQEIGERLRTAFGSRGLELEDVLIRDLRLPDTLKASIENKMKAEQDSLAMEFTLEREKKESERKKIEAQGLAESQKIISASLDPAYLQWYYIKSLQSVVDGHNNTVVILPMDQKLTPMLPLPASPSDK